MDDMEEFHGCLGHVQWQQYIESKKYRIMKQKVGKCRYIYAKEKNPQPHALNLVNIVV